MPYATPPSTLAGELRPLTARELSLPSRRRHVVLLVAASTMSAIVTVLLLTEPALPARTAVALGVLAAMGVSWMVAAAWALTRRRV